MEKQLSHNAGYSQAESEAQKHVEAILTSPSKKKIVVAGPGTGKTHLFKRIVAGKKKTLTLTFVNSLVQDLSLQLCGLSDVRTLHAFARSVVRNKRDDAKMFPLLPEVIKEDARALLGKDIDFEAMLRDLDHSNVDVEFYRTRRRYYDHWGFDDIVWAAVLKFTNCKDRIPAYEQILVDEYQDFNKLEISIIDLLAEKSPVLLAGDDDQALYEFKNASTEHIRKRHEDPSSGYQPFELPYCRRSTRVIVDAVNDIVKAAQARGLLRGRINKNFLYFPNKEKDDESEKNPKIVYAKVPEPAIPWFIEKQLVGIARQVKNGFGVLIISPSAAKSVAITDKLKAKGLENIEAAEKRDERKPSLLDGLKLLLERENNLGWRIVLKSLLPTGEFEAVLKKTHVEKPSNLSEIVPANVREDVIWMLDILKGIKDGKDDVGETDQEKVRDLLSKLGYDPNAIAKKLLRDGILSSIPRPCDASIRQIPIKGTTIEASKGLDREYVFITHFDDRMLVTAKDKTNISDRDICKFLVALTRARRKAFLISSDLKKAPTFLSWISRDSIEEIPWGKK
ncbi:MAG TPA: UvrD-helicase domain-containing protein [Candidatus Acidoferrum sp.]|nr:UvrD-helicase domain-containing protein [Candidatus Acidoferrum sp.]